MNHVNIFGSYCLLGTELIVHKPHYFMIKEKIENKCFNHKLQNIHCV